MYYVYLSVKHEVCHAILLIEITCGPYKKGADGYKAKWQVGTLLYISARWLRWYYKDKTIQSDLNQTGQEIGSKTVVTITNGYKWLEAKENQSQNSKAKPISHSGIKIIRKAFASEVIEQSTF